MGTTRSGPIALNVFLKQRYLSSPLLFVFYIKEIEDKVTESGKGVNIGDIVA